MTRANFEIICGDGKFKLQGNSSCYPSNIMKYVISFATSTRSLNAVVEGEYKALGFYENPDSLAISEFIEDIGLTFGSVGNPSYFYQIDFVKKVLKVWDYKKRWVNAPLDWEAKGWKGCNQNSKGKFGYTGIVKGKCIYSKYFVDLVSFRIEGDNVGTILNKKAIEYAESI